MYLHEKARRLTARLHLCVDNDGYEADDIRGAIAAMRPQLTQEECVELDILTALLQGPAKRCSGSGMSAPLMSAMVCPLCEQTVPVHEDTLSEHGTSSEHESGFLWRVLRSSDAVKKIAHPMLLHCPGCGGRHVDKGRWETKLHHTHACQHCGLVWRPAVESTVGVQFLPGFRDDASETAPPPPTSSWRGRTNLNNDQLWINGQIVGILRPDSNPDLAQARYTFRHADGRKETTPECYAAADYEKVRQWALSLVLKDDVCSTR